MKCEYTTCLNKKFPFPFSDGIYPKRKKNKKNIFGVFDTIISSLQVNSKNLQNLINNLEHQFSVIAVSDTWTSEGKKTKPSI